MKIACVIGSRSDAPGQIVIANALSERGVETVMHHLEGNIHDMDEKFEWMRDLDATVVLGDRHEIAMITLVYRQIQVPIAHVHAGELTGQEPDDTYRDVISRMATWGFFPHEQAGRKYDAKPEFVCGSPFITSAANTELITPIWSEGTHILVAFNPLPEKPEENNAIIKGLKKALKGQLSVHIIAPNTDRGNEQMKTELKKIGNVHDIIPHVDYLSLMATADIIIGNTSAGLIENTVWGTPYICVGSRQQYRVHGEHVLHRKPAEIEGAIREALDMGRRPNNSYGDKDSADKIARTLINEIEDMETA